jgi:hypothetical protein
MFDGESAAPCDSGSAARQLPLRLDETTSGEHTDLMFSYAAASVGALGRVWRVADGQKKRAARAGADADAGELAVARLLSRDAAYAAKVKRVRRYQARLRARLSKRGWQAYLQLEEVELARWAHALERVARWAVSRRRRRSP